MKHKIIKTIILNLITTLVICGCSTTTNTISKSFQEMNETKSLESNIKQEETLLNSQDDSLTSNTNINSHTVLIYMVGSDLESENGLATIELDEILGANVDTDKVNLLIYLGGANEWSLEGFNSSQNAILRLGKDNKFSIEYTMKSKNMGVSYTLSDFINYGIEHYPADAYGLILWDHGAGPVLGYGYDEVYQDILNLEEIDEALNNSIGDHNMKFEWIGFDACLMNSMEIASVLEPYSNYMIASQETEPGWGWDYYFLRSLSQKNMNGQKIGKEIIDSYIEYGNQVFDIYPRLYADLTLSCINLNNYKKVEDACNNFFNKIDTGLDTDSFKKISQSKTKMKSYGSYTSVYDYGMYDFIDFITKLEDATGISSQEIIDTMKDFVVYNKTNIQQTNGISICYPSKSDEEYRDEHMTLLKNISFSPDYISFLENYYDIENGKVLATNWNVSKSKSDVGTVPASDIGIGAIHDGLDISLQLTQEQRDNLASVSYFILCNASKEGFLGDGFLEEKDIERENDIYFYNYFGRSVEIDDNNVIHAYFNNSAMYMLDETDDEYSHIPLIIQECKDQVANERRYVSFCILDRFGEDILDWSTEAVELQVVVDADNPNGIIRSAVPLNSDTTDKVPSKKLLDLEDYDNLEFLSTAYYVTRDSEGKVLPYFDWEKTHYSLGFEQDLSHDYKLEIIPLHNPENYVCLFILKDTQGNTTTSELIPLGK